MKNVAALAEKIAAMNVNLEITSESNLSATTIEKLVRTVTEKNLHIKIHAANHEFSWIEKFAKIGGANITIVM